MTTVAAYVHTVPSDHQGFLARLEARIVELRTYLATRRELNALSDRQLADLGMTRSSVGETARRAVWGA